MIDINQETPLQLRLAADFLSQHATLREAMESQLATIVPVAAAQQAAAPPAAPAQSPPSIVVPTPPPSNVVPFAPPPPPVPAATVPAVPNAAASGAANTTPTPQASPTGTPVSAGPSRDPNAPLELDKTGMPWDVRIHQKGKSQKKDGSWKLQKGINNALVESVTQELHAMMINSSAGAPPADPAAVFGRTPLPAGATAPVPLPPGVAPPAPQAFAPPAPGTQASVSLPAAAAVPLPAGHDVGMPHAGNSGMVQGGFRELITKITAARTSGRLTAEQVTEIIKQAGAPSLQLLGSMAHLVPVVDALLDAALLGV